MRAMCATHSSPKPNDKNKIAAGLKSPRQESDAPREGQRLSKVVMALQGCSRRDAEQFIEGGWVSVNGQVVEEPMFRVSERGDQRVDIDPQASLLELTSVTLLLHKPPGFDAMAALGAQRPQGRGHGSIEPAQRLLNASSHFAQGSSLGPSNERVLKRHFANLSACVPLESAASGLVVFTQDWRVARKLVEDAALMEHELMVEVAGVVSPEALQKLNHSRKKEDAAVPPVKASISSTSDTSTRLRFAVKGAHPGLIAWLCERAGLEIQNMKRIRIGRVGLGQLPVGQWRYLTVHERF
jgi:23S rRNA pseudouridine2604 synthase